MNISGVMTKLEVAGVIAWPGYIDQDGDLHDKLMRGTSTYLQLLDWLLPQKRHGRE